MAVVTVTANTTWTCGDLAMPSASSSGDFGRLLTVLVNGDC